MNSQRALGFPAYNDGIFNILSVSALVISYFPQIRSDEADEHNAGSQDCIRF